MAKITNVNNLKSQSNGPDTWAGRWFFLLKEIAVQAGWTVVGSSDGDALSVYDGETAALDGADQGSGGAFDCWRTGTGRPHDGTKQAGDPREDSWIVLENDGRQVMLVPTWSTSSSIDGFGRIIYARKGSGGFDGSVAAVGTIPGPTAAAGDEIEIAGTRASTQGVAIFLGQEGGFIHYFADDTPDGGTITFGFVCVDGSGTSDTTFAIQGIVAETNSAVDPDPAVVHFAAAGVSVSGNDWASWNYGSNQFEEDNLNSFTQLFWGGNGTADPQSNKDPSDNIPFYIGVGASELLKGHLTVKGFLWSAVPRTYGDIGEDEDGNVFAYCGSAGGFLFPWPDVITAPLP